MGRLARGAVEAETTRMRDEPGLGRGGEGKVRPRPCRGVSDEAENEQLGSPAVAETYRDLDLTFHAALSLA